MANSQAHINPGGALLDVDFDSLGVEFMGDAGATLGSMMMVLSALGVQKGYREALCLVWCSSDREARGAALIHVLEK